MKCIFRDSDYKLPPVSREYVAALESRISSLESLLVNIKRAAGNERDTILEGVIFQDYLTSFASHPTNRDTELSEAMMKASLQETLEGTRLQFLLFCEILSSEMMLRYSKY